MKNAQMTIYLSLLGLLLSLVSPNVNADIWYEDGLTHNIAGTIIDSVYVRNDFFDNNTTVNIYEGASIINGYVNVGDDSILNFSGGSIDYRLIGYHNSQINMSGGTIGWRLWANDYCHINLTGGTIESEVRAFDFSEVEISGGTMWGLSTSGSGKIIFSGGTTSNCFLNDNSKIIFSGGINQGGSSVNGNSEIIFSGGLVGNSHSVSNSSRMIFMGTDFAINGVSVGFGTFGTDGRDRISGHLTGTLANGDLLDTTIIISDNASMILVVPEPTTLLLFGMGGLLMRKRK